MKREPLIVTIKRHSLEDGPGIRSVVFFKGCPLRCVFCHNPEAQEPGYELSFSAEQCLSCGQCVEACSLGAADLSLPGRVRRDICTVCGKCAEACPTGALRRVGEVYRIDELIEVLLRDSPYYRHSGGGVTLSGGEPTLYPEFLHYLLRDLKRRGVHICLETCGYYDNDVFRRMVLPYLDLIYFDLKLSDPSLHRKYTGKGNTLILENLARLQSDRPTSLQVRVPLIPEVTATPENLSRIRDCLLGLGIQTVILLPYNALGGEGRKKLGRHQILLSDRFMTAAEEDQAVSFFLSSSHADRKGGQNGSDRHPGRLCGQPALD
jgi:pyruvate formate lyase activating enzyme